MQPLSARCGSVRFDDAALAADSRASTSQASGNARRSERAGTLWQRMQVRVALMTRATKRNACFINAIRLQLDRDGALLESGKVAHTLEAPFNTAGLDRLLDKTAKRWDGTANGAKNASQMFLCILLSVIIMLQPTVREAPRCPAAHTPSEAHRAELLPAVGRVRLSARAARSLPKCPDARPAPFPRGPSLPSLMPSHPVACRSQVQELSFDAVWIGVTWYAPRVPHTTPRVQGGAGWSWDLLGGEGGEDGRHYPRVREGGGCMCGGGVVRSEETVGVARHARFRPCRG